MLPLLDYAVEVSNGMGNLSSREQTIIDGYLGHPQLHGRLCGIGSSGLTCSGRFA